MDLNLAVTQVKKNAPEFNRNVAGAAENEAAALNGYLATPAVYIIPVSDEVEQNNDMNGLTQVVTETIAAIIVLDNNVDRRGQASSALLDNFKAAVHRALLNWRGPAANVENTARGLQYDGGSLVKIDGGRLIYQMTYSQQVWLTDADGFQPEGDPLTHIDGKDQRLGDNSWKFDTTLAQDPPG